MPYRPLQAMYNDFRYTCGKIGQKVQNPLRRMRWNKHTDTVV